tara:strand:- start:221 stop:664 length:444 start_codon:yes stop_codon:yes gene_type:complete
LKIHIKEVNVETILPVRQAVLRNGKPREECFFEGDHAEETIHLALYIDEEIQAIATILKDKSEKLKSNNQFRLRGMAVIPEAQGKGLGKHLLVYAEDLIHQNPPAILWFYARKSAVKFYQKNNFEVFGKEFEIPTVGPHFLMFKNYE